MTQKNVFFFLRCRRKANAAAVPVVHAVHGNIKTDSGKQKFAAKVLKFTKFGKEFFCAAGIECNAVIQLDSFLSQRELSETMNSKAAATSRELQYIDFQFAIWFSIWRHFAPHENWNFAIGSGICEINCLAVESIKWMKPPYYAISHMTSQHQTSQENYAAYPVCACSHSHTAYAVMIVMIQSVLIYSLFSQPMRAYVVHVGMYYRPIDDTNPHHDFIPKLTSRLSPI